MDKEWNKYIAERINEAMDNLVKEFLEKIRSWLNTGNKSWYWEAIKSEYEERLPDGTGEKCEKELIKEFLEDLKSECLGGKYAECLYTMGSSKCDIDCANYKLYKKWEKRGNNAE